jgi:hypothetical protein
MEQKQKSKVMRGETKIVGSESTAAEATGGES